MRSSPPGPNYWVVAHIPHRKAMFFREVVDNTKKFETLQPVRWFPVLSSIGVNHPNSNMTKCVDRIFFAFKLCQTCTGDLKWGETDRFIWRAQILIKLIKTTHSKASKHFKTSMHTTAHYRANANAEWKKTTNSSHFIFDNWTKYMILQKTHVPGPLVTS